jgi:thioredoxin 1
MEQTTKFGDFINSEKPVLILFYADWNLTSRLMEKKINKVATELNGKARIITIDVDKNNELCIALKIMTVPTILILKDGEIKFMQSGEITNKIITQILKGYL